MNKKKRISELKDTKEEIRGEGNKKKRVGGVKTAKELMGQH